MPIRIQRSRAKGWRMPEGAIYVGRPTKWGNPFPAHDPGVQLECVALGLDPDDEVDCATASVDLYRRWVFGGQVSELVALMLPDPGQRPPSARHIERVLGGRDLACWCRPGAPCHADVLLEIANRPRCDEATTE